jgi:hypothetical protein
VRNGEKLWDADSVSSGSSGARKRRNHGEPDFGTSYCIYEKGGAEAEEEGGIGSPEKLPES